MKPVWKAVSFVALLGCGTSASQGVSSCPPCPDCPACASAVEPAGSADESSEGVGPEFSVEVGECDTSWLPNPYLAEVGEGAAAALVQVVRRWIEQGGGPRLDYGQGVVYAKSEDDTGMDPPYPSFVGRHVERACGSHQLWLRQSLRSSLRLHASTILDGSVRCSGNVCCYDAAMEYDSSGTFIFTPHAEGWVLRAVAIVADNATLQSEWIASERAWVTDALERHIRGRCRGEPSVVW